MTGDFAIAWGLMGVAFWVLLILLVVLLVSALRSPGRARSRPAVQVLEQRYARGEITHEEFLERRAVLGGGSTRPERDEPS